MQTETREYIIDQDFDRHDIKDIIYVALSN